MEYGICPGRMSQVGLGAENVTRSSQRRAASFF